MLGTLWHNYRLNRLKKQGLQIADDCRLMSMPNFGSEPYLISIGKHVTIASNVTFINHDGGAWVFRQQPKYKEVIKFGRITIHDNCFIGYGVTIMPGVTIGPNSVVGTGAVVTKDVPPNTVAVGLPAKPIMTIEEYAERSLAATPEYDRANYKSHKIEELLKLYPRPW